MEPKSLTYTALQFLQVNIPVQRSSKYEELREEKVKRQL